MHLVRPHDYNMKDRPLSKKNYIRESPLVEKLIPGYKGLLHFKDQKGSAEKALQTQNP